MWSFISTFGLSYPRILIAWISFPMQSLGYPGIRTSVLLRSPEAWFQQHILWRVQATENSARCPPWKSLQDLQREVSQFDSMNFHDVIPKQAYSQAVHLKSHLLWHILKTVFFFPKWLHTFCNCSVWGLVKCGSWQFLREMTVTGCHDFGPFLVLKLQVYNQVAPASLCFQMYSVWLLTEVTAP